MKTNGKPTVMKNRNRSCGGLTENENSNNSNNGVLMDEK
jgi:hypothetical protein